MKQVKKFNLDRTPGQPKRRRKITLVFDENKRKEFLTGFHKRKLERKKKAKEQLEKQLKEERKKIKQTAKETLKKMVSYRPIPELEELLKKEEFEMAGRTVSILELDTTDLEKRVTTIGSNKVDYEDDTEPNDSSNPGKENTKIPPGSLKKSSAKENEKKPGVVKQGGSQKEVKKTVRKAALKQVQKSKAFQIKKNLERNKNKKDSRKKVKSKVTPKTKRGKHARKFNTSNT